MLGDPAVEIGERAGAQGLLLRDRFFVAAQSCAVGLARRRGGERGKQPEIDVHRLKRARTWLGGFDVAAGDVT